MVVRLLRSESLVMLSSQDCSLPVVLVHQAAARADWLDAKDYYEKLQRGYNASTCA